MTGQGGLQTPRQTSADDKSFALAQIPGWRFRLLLANPHLLLDLLERAEEKHARGVAGAGFDAGLGLVEVVAVALDALHRARREADVEEREVFARLSSRGFLSLRFAALTAESVQHHCCRVHQFGVGRLGDNWFGGADRVTDPLDDAQRLLLKALEYFDLAASRPATRRAACPSR